MLSEKVRLVLIAKDAPFKEEEMKGMTDREGWAWIYANRPPGQTKRDHGLPEICFTGFGDSHKAELQGIAKEYGFKCVTDVTKNLRFLCTGENPGPVKLKKAAKQGVPIISEGEFLAKLADWLW